MGHQHSGHWSVLRGKDSDSTGWGRGVGGAHTVGNVLCHQLWMCWAYGRGRTGGFIVTIFLDLGYCGSLNPLLLHDLLLAIENDLGILHRLPSSQAPEVLLVVL